MNTGLKYISCFWFSWGRDHTRMFPMGGILKFVSFQTKIL